MSQSTGNIARHLRKIPGVAQLEGELKGVFAEASDLPIGSYDKLTAGEINEKLPSMSQLELAMIDVYERSHQNRKTVSKKLAVLRRTEPWSGYDELTADEIKKALAVIDAPEKLTAVAKYERAHKNRSTVIGATERELAHR